MRGLKAFRCAGAIRAFAQLWRRAVHFVLDVTSTRGQVPLARTSLTPFFDNLWMIPASAITPVDMTGRVRLQASLQTAFDLSSNVTPHGEC